MLFTALSWYKCLIQFQCSSLRLSPAAVGPLWWRHIVVGGVLCWLSGSLRPVWWNHLITPSLCPHTGKHILTPPLGTDEHALYFSLCLSLSFLLTSLTLPISLLLCISHGSPEGAGSIIVWGFDYPPNVLCETITSSFTSLGCPSFLLSGVFCPFSLSSWL